MFHAKKSAVKLIFLTVISVMPLATNAAVFIPLNFLLLALFCGFIYFATRSRQKSVLLALREQAPWVFYLLLAFALLSVLSWLNMLSSEAGLQQKFLSTIYYFVYVVLALYSFMFVRFSRQYHVSQQEFFQCLLLGTWLLLLTFAAIYFFADAPNARKWNSDAPFMGNIRIVGMLAAVSTISAAVLYLFNQNNIWRGTILLLSVLAMNTFLVWTGSRMSIIASIVCLLVLLFLMKLWQQVSWWKMIGVSSVFIVAFPLGETLSLPWGGLHRSVDILANSLQADNALEEFSNNRFDVWRSAWQAALVKPLLGHAPFGYFFVEDGIARINGHAHNIVLQLLVEWGFIGAGLFLFFLVQLAWQGVKHIRQAFLMRDVNYILAASVILLLTINALTDGTYYLPLTCFILATAYAQFPFRTGVKIKS